MTPTCECEREFSFAKFSKVQSSDNYWQEFIQRYIASIHSIIGHIDLRAGSDTASMEVVEDELEALRSRVEELNDEVYSTLSS